MSETIEYGEFEKGFDRIHSRALARKHATEISQRRISMSSGISVLQEIVVIPKDVQELMPEEDLQRVSRFHTVLDTALPVPRNLSMSESYVNL